MTRIKTTRVSPRIAILAILLTCLALAPAVNAQVAELHFGAGGIDFAPAVQTGKVFLTVSGPGEYYHHAELGADQSSFLSLFDEAGNVLPDGVYTYELTVGPAETLRREVLDGAQGLPGHSTSKAARGRTIQSGSFTIRGGALVDPTQRESDAGGAPEGNRLLTKDVLHYDDVIITGSLCVGFDCVNGETFGYDTIKLKENNLRIGFDDTSTGSFPTGNWQIRVNDTTSGGASYFGVVDMGTSGTSTGGTRVFAVEAGAPSNAVYVDDYGRVGFGTSVPVTELHTVDGDTPTLRLQQDGSSGFAAQTWDLAGNETNFFVRDVTNGSTLPFRIRPGAPSSSIYIDTDGDVGIGDSSPDAKLDVENGVLRVEASSSSGDPRIHVISNQSQSGASGQPGFKFENTNSDQVWDFRVGGAGNLILNSNSGAVEFTFATNGDFTATGTKSFAVMDPDGSGDRIYYAALEGPEAGTYYRGTAQLVDGKAVIELPRYFSKVTEKDGVTVQLTPVGGWGQLYVDEMTPERLVIRVADGSKDLKFNYLVHGIRAGYKDFKVERPGDEALGQ